MNGFGGDFICQDDEILYRCSNKFGQFIKKTFAHEQNHQ